jgi:hypothetical protein
MMLGVTAEQVPEWDAELSALTGSLGFLFNRPEPRVVFAHFNEGLLAELPKKNGWTLSERAVVSVVWIGVAGFSRVRVPLLRAPGFLEVAQREPAGPRGG